MIALFLAIAETFAKSAQTDQISYNVEASNLWSFYQAKTIRQTTLRTAAEQMTIDVALAKDPAVKVAARNARQTVERNRQPLSEGAEDGPQR